MSANIRHLAVLLNGPGRSIGADQRYEIPICLAGSWVKDGHKLSITAEDLSAMVRNFEKRKNEQVVIDYEHASEHPEISRRGAVPAAGWIDPCAHSCQWRGVNGQCPFATGYG